MRGGEVMGRIIVIWATWDSHLIYFIFNIYITSLQFIIFSCAAKDGLSGIFPGYYQKFTEILTGAEFYAQRFLLHNWSYYFNFVSFLVRSRS